MKKMLLLCVALLSLAAVAAFASPGAKLAWTDCAIDGGAINKDFACSSNSGSETLIFSWEPEAEVPVMNGAEGFVDIYFPTGSQVTAWWSPTACAAKVPPVSISATLPSSANLCQDAWNGNALAALAAYNSPLFIQHGIITPGYDNTAQIDMLAAVPAGGELDALPGNEYYLFTVGIKRAGTTGGTACAGCTTPAILNAQGVWVTQPAPEPQQEIYTQSDRNNVTVFSGTGVVATHSKTWGALKAMYR